MAFWANIHDKDNIPTEQFIYHTTIEFIYVQKFLTPQFSAHGLLD
jgi:hypothetical protein